MDLASCAECVQGLNGLGSMCEGVRKGKQIRAGVGIFLCVVGRHLARMLPSLSGTIIQLVVISTDPIQKRTAWPGGLRLAKVEALGPGTTGAPRVGRSEAGVEIYLFAFRYRTIK